MAESPDISNQNEKDLMGWFQRYMAVDGNVLSRNSDVIREADADELDLRFVEQQIMRWEREVNITQGFCAKCQDLFNKWPTLGSSSTRTHESKPNLVDDGWEYAVGRSCSTFEIEASTRSGCRFCTFILQSLKDSELLDTFRKVEARLYQLEKEEIASLCIQNWGGNPLQLLWLNLPGKVCTSCNSGIAIEAKVVSAFLPASADCYDKPLEVLEIARNWFQTCSEGHELCNTSSDEDTPPTRLISIVGESPRLISTSECPQKPRYATLSHSWGSHDVIKLTSYEIDNFRTVIPVEKLPATFKDAIEIAKSLGLDFLWIDSLCIIQDSEDDWQRESALMRSVYGGSAINIAASSAQDSSQGCFLKPPIFSGGIRARITDGGQQRVQDFRNSEEYDLSTFETHLGSRAWALQEKLLSPRTIHFSNRGAFWECRTKIGSEYLPDGFPKALVSPLVRRRGKLETMWPQIVRIYSAANLTFGKDKLPALSGIARLGYNESGDQYLAGLWMRQIEEQLCWIRWGSECAAKRPPWRAPTWSWASIDGKVNWYVPQERVLETKHVHVLDASTTKYGPDPFGQVTSGIIRLACSSMASAYLFQSKRSDELEAEVETHIVVQDGKEEQKFVIQFDCSDDINQDSKEPIYLLPILSGRSGRGVYNKEDILTDEIMICGIVLQATATNGQFSRIGSFSFYKDRAWAREQDHADEESYVPFLQVLEESGGETAEAVCAEIVSNSRYPREKFIITLV